MGRASGKRGGSVSDEAKKLREAHERLVAKRKEMLAKKEADKAAAKRDARVEPESAAEAMIRDNGIVAACDRMIAIAKAERAKFEAWLKTQNTAAKCEEHGTPLTLDLEGSHLKSVRSKVNQLVFGECKACSERARLARVSEWMKRAGVPENLLHCEINNWIPNGSKEQADALATAKRFIECPGGSLVLQGPDYGVGKTHLAVAILRAAGRGWFITQNDFLIMLRRTYRDERAPDPVMMAKTARCFVLDEVGLSGGGRDELPSLHAVLSFRYGNGLKTVLTSNLLGEEFEAAIGERMIDRLSEGAFGRIELHGDSKRRGRRTAYFDMVQKKKKRT